MVIIVECRPFLSESHNIKIKLVLSAQVPLTYAATLSAMMSSSIGWNCPILLYMCQLKVVNRLPTLPLKIQSRGSTCHAFFACIFWSWYKDWNYHAHTQLPQNRFLISYLGASDTHNIWQVRYSDCWWKFVANDLHCPTMTNVIFPGMLPRRGLKLSTSCYL